MTMAELRQKRKTYETLKAEIADLEKQIKDLEQRQIVTDVVKGSSTEYPYTEHPVKIEGKGADSVSKALAKRAKEIKDDRLETERKLKECVSFIEHIDERMVRRAVELKIIKGLSWQQIVNRFDNVLTEAALIMRVKRTLENI